MSLNILPVWFPALLNQFPFHSYFDLSMENTPFFLSLQVG
jgi:hypothetical protein